MFTVAVYLNLNTIRTVTLHPTNISKSLVKRCSALWLTSFTYSKMFNIGRHTPNGSLELKRTEEGANHGKKVRLECVGQMVQSIHFQVLSCFSKPFPLAFYQVNAKRSGNIWSFRLASPKIGCKEKKTDQWCQGLWKYSSSDKSDLSFKLLIFFKYFQSLVCRAEQLECGQTRAALTLVQLLHPKIMTTKGFQGKFWASVHTPHNSLVDCDLCSLQFKGLGGGVEKGWGQEVGDGGDLFNCILLETLDHFC